MAFDSLGQLKTSSIFVRSLPTDFTTYSNLRVVWNDIQTIANAIIETDIPLTLQKTIIGDDADAVISTDEQALVFDTLTISGTGTLTIEGAGALRVIV